MLQIKETALFMECWSELCVLSQRAAECRPSHAKQSGRGGSAVGGGLLKVTISRENPPVISLCRPNRFTDSEPGQSVLI